MKSHAPLRLALMLAAGPGLAAQGTPAPAGEVGAWVGMGEGPQEGFNPAYDVSRDGTRFVVVQNVRQP